VAVKLELKNVDLRHVVEDGRRAREREIKEETGKRTKTIEKKGSETKD
jgi:hypothetical protein